MARTSNRTTTTPKPEEEADIRQAAINSLTEVEEIDLSDAPREKAVEISDKFVFGEDFNTSDELRDLVVQELVLTENGSKDVVEAVDTDKSQRADTKEAKYGIPPSNLIRFVKSGLMIGTRIYSEGQVVEVTDSVYNQTDEDQVKSYGDVYFVKA